MAGADVADRQVEELVVGGWKELESASSSDAGSVTGRQDTEQSPQVSLAPHSQNNAGPPVGGTAPAPGGCDEGSAH